MAVLPFMQWYPADYAGDTTHLTDEEDLAYRRLLDAMWLRGGKLPDNEAQLALIVGYSGPKWDACWPVLRSFFKKNKHGFLVQKRLSTEYRKAKKLHDARVRGGKSAHSSAHSSAGSPPKTQQESGNQLRARGYLEPEPEPEPVSKDKPYSLSRPSGRQRAHARATPAMNFAEGLYRAAQNRDRRDREQADGALLAAGRADPDAGNGGK